MNILAPLVVEIADADAAPALAALHAAVALDAWDASAFAALLGTPGTAARLIREADRAVGFVIWRTVADEAEILMIAVEAVRRRRSRGRTLMGAAMAAAAAGGAKRMFLEVAEDNFAARSFYRGLGFAAVNRRANYYSRPEGHCDALVLCRAIGGTPAAA